MIYLCEQLKFLEKAIVTQAELNYVSAFGGKKRVSLVSREAVSVMMYEHFKEYEGPLLARYMLIIQLYSVLERYSVAFSKDIINADDQLELKGLTERARYEDIKEFYSNALDSPYEHWSELNALNLVRNLIAHCDGYLAHSVKKVRTLELVDGDSDLMILSDGRLVLRTEFLKRCMRAVLRFFELIELKAISKDTMLDFSWGRNVSTSFEPTSY